MKKFIKFLKDGASEPITSADEKLATKDVTPEGKGKKRRRLMFKSMFVMSIIFIMISVSYTWFISANKGRITGVDIGVVEPKNLTTSGIVIMGQLSPVTGDGKNFFIPEMGEVELETGEGDDYVTSIYGKTGDTYTQLTDDVISETLSSDNIKNIRVIQFSIEVDEAEQLYLADDTVITPANGAPDYLVGALRVAILKKNAENTYDPLLIWVPDIESTIDGEDELEGEYTFVSSAGTETIEVNVNDDKVGDVPCVFGDLDEDGVALGDPISGTATYRCVIWLDGNDRECNADLIGQQFEFELNILPGGQD